jgi:hypothetical protein
LAARASRVPDVRRRANRAGLRSIYDPELQFWQQLLTPLEHSFLNERTTAMKLNTEVTSAGQQYAAAYAAHYSERNVPLALQLYGKLVASCPGAPEAEYSRMQVHNIVNAVVPKQTVLESEIKLALAHFECNGSLVAGRHPVAPLVSGLPA